jgi:two-component system CheB/CheR fusion protein
MFSPQCPLPGPPVIALGAGPGTEAAMVGFFSGGDVPEAVWFVAAAAEGAPGFIDALRPLTKMPLLVLSEQPAAVLPGRIHLCAAGHRLIAEEGMVRAVAESGKVGTFPIDGLLRDLSAIYHDDLFAVLLAGPGGDGIDGLVQVREQGGVCLLEASAVEPVCNVADLILPADQMIGKISAILRLRKTGQTPQEQIEREGVMASANIRDILTLVRVRTGHDFSNYRLPTITRRIGQRVQVNELPDLPAYVNFLRDHADEVQRLLGDLLITVTSFFRDTDCFDSIEKEMIPRLFDGKGSGDCVRVWSCGCSSGEEPYSLGMLLMEYRDTLPEPPRIQIFASDINQEAIRHAREGRYKAHIAGEISEERLKRFFTLRANGSYQVNKELRDTVLFAPHNILHDPPFSHLDLIVCRNLLIYFNRETQKRVMELFSFSLDMGKYLFLGSSEGIEGAESLFRTLDKKNRFFENSQSVKRSLVRKAQVPMRWEPAIPEPGGSPLSDASLEYHHHRLMSHYAPPSVLINSEHEIVHTGGGAGEFMLMPSGLPTQNLIRCVQPALQLDLRAALMTARAGNRESEVRGVKLSASPEKRVNLLVRPAELSGVMYFLVVFDVIDAVRERTDISVLESISGDTAMEGVVRRLEEELQETRERLHHTIEQGEVMTEELKASNEELQAINEELRSATEELETSKEELQSVNEELSTVNLELKEKVEEISNNHSDLQNLMHSSDIGTIFLNRELKVKRFTQRVQQLFNIIETDIGRPFDHITHKFEYPSLLADAAQVLETLRPIERLVKVDASSYFARLTPYRTLDNRIEGVVLSFVDITELSRSKPGN